MAVAVVVLLLFVAPSNVNPPTMTGAVEVTNFVVVNGAAEKVNGAVVVVVVAILLVLGVVPNVKPLTVIGAVDDAKFVVVIDGAEDDVAVVEVVVPGVATTGFAT